MHRHRCVCRHLHNEAGEYVHNFYIAQNLSPCVIRIFVVDNIGYIFRFYVVVPESHANKSNQIEAENIF